MARFLVTGGCGFIGSNLIDLLLKKKSEVIVLDALSFGSDVRNLPEDVKIVGGISGQMVTEIPRGRCVLVVGDVADAHLVQRLVDVTDGVFHLAAQTHVDRSYGDVLPFVNSNVVGAYSVLEAVRSAKHKVRCIFMSTDEVYGDIETGFSVEGDPLAPRNIYSALKAGGDLLAQTYAAVFKLDLVIARPANNYGPRQFFEKLVPKTIKAVIGGGKVPVYGDGKQVRDWLWVEDCVAALLALHDFGKSGHAYNVGAGQFRGVLDVIRIVSELLSVDWKKHVDFVEDRIRGDRRYALDYSKIQADTGWKPTKLFEDGIKETVAWYKERAGK